MSDAGIVEDLTRSVEEITLGFIDDITPPAIAFALVEAVLDNGDRFDLTARDIGTYPIANR